MKDGSEVDVSKDIEEEEEEEEEKIKTDEKREKKEKEEEKVVEEKVFKINLRNAYLEYGRKAAPKAVRLLRKIGQRVADTEDVKIHSDLNARLWSRGKTKTLRRITIRIQKLEDGTARLLPAGA
ncbi:MAG: hypothetical protein ACUVQ5_06195 [Candidatus Methanomethylicaceae archaeon]